MFWQSKIRVIIKVIGYLALLLLLLFVVGVVIFIRTPQGGGGYPRITATQTELYVFKTAMETFKADCGRFPTTSEGLQALMKCPPSIDAHRWHGPYLDGNSVRMDPWGHPYFYQCPAPYNTNGYAIYSLGPHGRGGVEAIANGALH